MTTRLRVLGRFASHKIHSSAHKITHLYHAGEDLIHATACGAVAFGNHELYAHLSGFLAIIIVGAFLAKLIAGWLA